MKYTFFNKTAGFIKRVIKLVLVGSVLIILLVFAYVCYDLEYENDFVQERLVQVAHSMQTKSVNDTVLLNMSSVTNFKWDTLYTFYSTGLVREVSQAIGAPSPTYANVHEHETLFIFMKNGRVVHSTLFQRLPDNQEPNSLNVISAFSPGELFTPATATFKVTRDNIHDNTLLVLHFRNKAPIYRPHYDPHSIEYQP